MMRKFQDGSDKLIMYTNVIEYKQMLNRPILRGRDNSSESGSENWTGTKSFETAIDLLTRGDRKSLDELVEVKNKIDKEFETQPMKRFERFESPVGYTPIVPNAILGLPNSMQNQRRVEQPSKIIDIFYNASWASHTSTETITYNGAFILAYIDKLEKSGYRVNLYVGKIAGNEGAIQGHGTLIKRDSEPLNILQTAFYLVNPSFLRRVAFRIDETEEFLPDITWNGYGDASGYDDFRRLIRSALVDNDVITLDRSTGIREDNDFDDNFKRIQKEFAKSVYK